VWYSLVAQAYLIVGGTYPVQAILSSRLINVFTLQGSEAKQQADFYALICTFDEYLKSQAASLPHFPNAEQLTLLVSRVLGQILASSIFRAPTLSLSALVRLAS
jgi:hypothetical protein